MATGRREAHQHDGRAASPAALAASLFLLSFATALFTLATFRLLSFFIMPSLFFDLLFIGFPIGAFVGARWFADDARSYQRSLWWLQAMMASSIACGLTAKRFDYLRAHLFDVEVIRLVGQVGAFAGLFLPFFVAYGLAEYLGYQVGRKHLGGRVRTVYAIALFGAAAAYVLLRALLPTIGMARMLLLAIAATALAVAAVARQPMRYLAFAELAVAAGVALVPGLEGEFLALYKGEGQQSTWQFIHEGRCRPVFQKWGRYSLTEILQARDHSNYYGFYNDFFQWEYAPEFGFRTRALGTIPLLYTRRGDSVCIVGAGGGRQVRLGALLGGRRIVALELEPAVLEAVRSPQYLREAFRRVYEMPGVTAYCAEARGYLERSRERFDLIYLPSVGGYPQMMIEPGNMVRTFEAYQTMRQRLTDRGVLAIWYPSGLDPKGILTDQYVRTLRSLGMRTEAYRTSAEFLIMAFNDPSAQPPTAKEMDEELNGGQRAQDVPAEFRTRRYAVAESATFRPITDDRPFLGGNVRHVLSVAQVRELFGTAAGVLVVAGAAVTLALRRHGDPRLPDRPFAAVGALALLIGANFLLMEHALVLGLFRRLFVYDDALGLGAVSFLMLSGIGSLLARGRLRPVVTMLVAIGVLVLLAAPGRLSAGGVLAILAPVALATGSFFPALFDACARKPLAVFALDAVGAGLGALAATFVPLLGGFHAFFFVAGAVFLITAGVDAWFHRGGREDSVVAAANGAHICGRRITDDSGVPH